MSGVQRVLRRRCRIGCPARLGRPFAAEGHDCTRLCSWLAATTGADFAHVYQCRLCQLDCPNKTAQLQQTRSFRHYQLEQLAKLQRRSSSANGSQGDSGSAGIARPLRRHRRRLLRRRAAEIRTTKATAQQVAAHSISITSPVLVCPPIHFPSSFFHSLRNPRRHDPFIKKTKQNCCCARARANWQSRKGK